MAHLYCLSLNETTVKIGYHLGDHKSLTDRYGTYVCEEYLTKLIMVPVEPENRIIFEKALHRLLQRHDGIHKEKEKYTNEAKNLFLSYTATFRLPPTKYGVVDTVHSEPSTRERYDQMLDEKRLKKVVEYEEKKRREVQKTVHDLVQQLIDSALLNIIEPSALHMFLSDTTKVEYVEGVTTKLVYVERAFYGCTGLTSGYRFDYNVFREIHSDWRMTRPMVCAFCDEEHNLQPNCCKSAAKSIRTKGLPVVHNLRLCAVPPTCNNNN